MVLAIALILGAPDHWDLGWPGASHSHGEDEAASAAAHARHCHGDAATCTDLPLTSIGGLAALENWLGLPPRFVAARVPASSERPPDDRAEVTSPPPRGDS